jgi:hypothetical protein
MTSGGSESAPVDFEVLDRVYTRLRGDERFEDVNLRPEYAPNSLVLHYDSRYFPSFVVTNFLQIRWYTNDDFNIHYEEEHEEVDTWKCRWDRHPNSHNQRGHFHTPPDASTPGEDLSYAKDWRDVISLVLDELDNHIQGFWKD